MRGRKPDATAVRRGESAAMLIPQNNATTTVADTVGHGADKPAHIAANEQLSEMWDVCVGSGAAYEPQDVPTIAQYVTYMVLADECRRHLFKPDGTPMPMIEEEDEYGNIIARPNPYMKQMTEATNMALKLADELGLTRFARTRLGLAQATGQAITLSIAEQIDRTIERRGRK